MTLEGFDGPWEPRSLSKASWWLQHRKLKIQTRPFTRSFTIERKTNGRIFGDRLRYVESILTDSRDGKGVASRIHYVDDQPRIAFFESDDNLAGVLKYFTEEFPGDHISITGTTEDSSKVVVAVSSSNKLGDYYLYDRESNSVRYLIGMTTKLSDVSLSRSQYFAIRTVMA